jgi:hypothetical protein
MFAFSQRLLQQWLSLFARLSEKHPGKSPQILIARIERIDQCLACRVGTRRPPESVTCEKTRCPAEPHHQRNELPALQSTAKTFRCCQTCGSWLAP